MTKDFRNVGKLPSDDMRSTVPASAPTQNIGGRRIVLIVLLASAAGFMAGGLWLLNGGGGILQGETAVWVGIAFIASAILDVVIVLVLNAIWRRRSDSRPG